MFQSNDIHSQQLPGIDLALKNYNIDSLKDIYGKNKTFIREYELVFLLALSYYPELKETSIIFKFSNEGSTGKATIALASFFKAHRKYIIYINSKRKKTGFLLNEAPLNAQVAVIGHELSHIIDFSHRNVFGLIGWGIKYLNKKQKRVIERRTDIITIEHGLGRQLYEWSLFAENNPNLSDSYKKVKKKYYLQPNEILELIK